MNTIRRRSRSGWACLIGFTLIATAVTAAQDTAPQGPDAAAPRLEGPLGPVHDEPHHRQLFQRGPMRILDLQLPPGDISWFHTHEWPVLYLTLANSQLRTQNMGEEWGGGAGRGRAGGAAEGRGGAGAAAPAGRGAAATAPSPEGRGAAGAGNPAGAANPAGRGTGPAPSTSPRPTSTITYAERPITHRLQNVGTTLLRAMVVVNETQGGDEAVTSQAMGFSARPELTNRWFRAYRVALSPGETTASHRHQAPVVFLQATAGKGIGRGAVAWEFNEPGQWAFFDIGDTHEIRNTGESRLELIEVELRR